MKVSFELSAKDIRYFRDRLESVRSGKQATDGDTAQVGPSLAEKLGIPHTTYVRKIQEIREGYIRCERMTDDGYEVIEMTLPAVITVVKEINEPRLPSFKAMMRAKKAVINVWTADDVGANKDQCGLQEPTRNLGINRWPMGGQSLLFWI